MSNGLTPALEFRLHHWWFLRSDGARMPPLPCVSSYSSPVVSSDPFQWPLRISSYVWLQLLVRGGRCKAAFFTSRSIALGRAAKCFIFQCKPKSTLLMPGMWSHRFQAPWSLLILLFDRFPHQHNAITARDFRWPFYHPAIICWARLWRSLLISESSWALTWRSSSSHCGVNLCGYFVVVLILTQLGYCLNHSFSSDWCNRFNNCWEFHSLTNLGVVFFVLQMIYCTLGPFCC